MSDEQRPQAAPISWEALAAELAATREEGERRGDADPGTWDAVARELAARVAEQPVEVEPVVDVPPADEPTADVPPADEPTADVPPADVPAADVPPADEPAAVPVQDPTPPDVPVGEPAPGPAPELLDPAEVRGGLEALLFVMDAPVDEPTLAAALRCPPDQVRAGLEGLGESYRARSAGIALRRVGEGWRLYTSDEHAAVVERFLGDERRSRLTQAALETLAVIAYRQPVTRARVSAIRGVGVDGVMRTLLGRGLVSEVGTDPDSGGGLYATTPLFLERLGLTGLDELPELAPLLPETSSMTDEHPDA